MSSVLFLLYINKKYHRFGNGIKTTREKSIRNRVFTNILKLKYLTRDFLRIQDF